MEHEKLLKLELKYSNLQILLDIIQNEPFFRIQIFSLESIILFEKFLQQNRIQYEKQFTSNYIKKDTLVVLLNDSELPETIIGTKLILYSNQRDHRFIPYKFTFTIEEKKKAIKNPHLFEIYKQFTITSVFKNKIDFHKYTADSLNYLQSLIIFCMIRERSFNNLCKEIESVDPSIKNKFLIKCELNELVKLKICKQFGTSYVLNISNETLQFVCEKIGFGKALKY